MQTANRPEPTVFVIFGAGGDLTWRKLIPALYNLLVDGWLPEKFRILGMGHQAYEQTRSSASTCGRGGPVLPPRP